MKFNLTKFVKYLKGANFILATFFLVLFAIVAYNNAPEGAQAAFTAASTNFPATNILNSQTVTLNAAGVYENLSADGVYTATYRISNPAGQPVSFPLIGAIHRCVEGNGHRSLDGIRFPVCEQVDAPYNGFNMNLNAGNNYAQDVTLTTTQVVPMACGSYQTDLFSNTPTPNLNGFFYASIKFTGINCPEPTPTPTPTPSETPTPTPTPTPSATPTPTPYPSHTPYPTPTPTPSHTPHPTPTPTMTPTPTPAPTPSTVQCPFNWINQIFGSTIVCVSQNQEQNQAQIQNNNQNQDVNQNVSATGGSSSSTSSSSSNVDVKVNN